MQNFKTNQRGITLIALIITIIVMLILVGVTINVALNGGLFEQATKAKTATEKELEKEELMQLSVGEYDVQTGKVDLDALKEKMANNYTEDTNKSREGETLVLQGKSGTFWEINLVTVLVKEYEKTITYNQAYVGNVEGIEVSVTFYEDGSMNYSVPYFNVDANPNYTIKSVGSVVIGGIENTYNNAVCSDYYDFTDEEFDFFGYFNEDFSTVTIIAGHANDMSSVQWCECILTQ